MKRRDLLTGFLAGGAFTFGNALLWKQAQDNFAPQTDSDPLLNDLSMSRDPRDPQVSLDPVSDREGAQQGSPNYLDKVRNFENEFADDIYLSEAELPLLHSVLLRFKGVERTVGHGNYNLISFDDLLKFAGRYANVGEFTRQELDFVEKIFFTEAKQYGFLGEKVTTELTSVIAKKDTYKVPYSGHYLYRSDSLSYYETLKKDVGAGIILTSGIRSNVKQMHLFLAKAVKSSGNLSKASRSLAPPGHSYHGVGDFDVGRIGWGSANFTDEFAKTDEFKRMQDLGYVQIRYTADNRFGVRFEPWHIKVV